MLKRYWVRLSVGALTFSCNGANAQDFFVSPIGSGSACTRSAPCSLQLAPAVARNFLKNQKQDIHIRLADGVYRLTKPINLTAEDSGRNGFKIIWEAQDGAHPVISGGVQVTSWTLYDASRNIWRANAPMRLNSRQLYVDGQRAQHGRTADLLQSGFTVTDRGYVFPDAISGKPIDFSTYRNIPDMEVVRSLNWQVSRCRVSVATATTLMVNPVCLANSKTSNLTIFVENAFELIRRPGDWYLDRTGAVSGSPSVYYIPRKGQDMRTTQAVMGNAENLLRLSGSGPENKIHDITIRGLTFAYGTWHDDQGPVAQVGGYAGLQAGVYLLSFADYLRAERDPNPRAIPRPLPVAGGFYDRVNLGYEAYLPAAVMVDYASRVNIEQSKFLHLGYSGISMIRGIDSSTVVGNLFQDLSGSAIQLGGVEEEDGHPCGDIETCRSGRITTDNVLSNNKISQIGQDYFDAAAIFAGYTRNTLVSQNEIRQIPYTAISIGWGWGWLDKGAILGNQSSTIMASNKIAHNKITDFLLKQRDGGGVYTLGSQPRSEISGNFIKAGKNDYAAIYQDEGSSGFNVYGNLMAGVHYSIYINCGKHDVTSENSYFDNHGDSGAIHNGCLRGKNAIEPVTVDVDRDAKESDWSEKNQAIVSAAGIGPDYQTYFADLAK